MSQLHDEQPFKVVRMWDLAIDVDACAACREDRADIAHSPCCIWKYTAERDFDTLVMREGVRPMVVEVRRLRDDVAVRLSDIAGDSERARAAFAYAVVTVTDGIGRDGKPFADRAWQPNHVRGDARGRRESVMTADELALFDPATQIEIGAVAYRHSFFVPGSERLFTLPPTSAAAWGALGSRRAALRLSRRTPLSDAPGTDSVLPPPTSDAG